MGRGHWVSILLLTVWIAVLYAGTAGGEANAAVFDLTKTGEMPRIHLPLQSVPLSEDGNGRGRQEKDPDCTQGTIPVPV